MRRKIYKKLLGSRTSADDRMEIDFLIAKPITTSRHNISPIEVKSGQRYTLNSLRKCIVKYSSQLSTPYVLHDKDIYDTFTLNNISQGIRHNHLFGVNSLLEAAYRHPAALAVGCLYAAHSGLFSEPLVQDFRPVMMALMSLSLLRACIGVRLSMSVLSISSRT